MKSHRGTIFLENAPVLQHTAYDGQQFVLRLGAPKCAARAEPGSFVHLTCAATIPMRRPLSIMRADPQAGWIEVLYKVLGPGLQALATRKQHELISTLGPIGRPFVSHPDRRRPLLLGGGVGIPPMIFLAERMRDSGDAGPGGSRARWSPLVLMGSEVPFPFRTRPSKIVVPGMPPGAIGCMPLLEQWDIASRLATRAGYAGCFDGFVTELAAQWLQTLDAAARSEVEIFACGPLPMLEATARLARGFDLPCQVSLEEFMACAVGGCAGCTIPVHTPQGPAMRRVCVDGPVFDAAQVFPA